MVAMKLAALEIKVRKFLLEAGTNSGSSSAVIKAGDSKFADHAKNGALFMGSS